VVVNKNLKLKGPHTGRFIIGKDGVTLDCGGHTVTGAGRDVTVGGVQIVGRKNVSIRNCHLRDHFFGVLLVDSNRNVLSRNRMTHVGDGFNLVRSDSNKLLQNAVTDASYSGVALFEGSDKNRIVGNVVADLADIGFTLQSNSSRNHVTGNSASRAGNSGFLVHHSGAGNAFSGNSATDNTGFGFSDNTTGFRGDAGTDNTYAENTCAGNSFGDSSPQTLCD
jgi:parallel beta-helix repeat protein